MRRMPSRQSTVLLPAISRSRVQSVGPPRSASSLTSKVGSRLPEGAFLADKGQQGVWRSVLGPGRYRLNPQGVAALRTWLDGVWEHALADFHKFAEQTVADGTAGTDHTAQHSTKEATREQP